MGTAQKKSEMRFDYEILFLNSPSYALVKNAQMINEGPMVRFICYDENGSLKEDFWYPRENIFRIKTYSE